MDSNDKIKLIKCDAKIMVGDNVTCKLIYPYIDLRIVKHRAYRHRPTVSVLRCQFTKLNSSKFELPLYRSKKNKFQCNALHGIPLA